LKPERRRAQVDDLMRRYGASLTRAGVVMHISRSVYRYESCARESSLLKMRIKEITDVRVHYGYRQVHMMLRRESFVDNHML
jgi:putative transposase